MYVKSIKLIASSATKEREDDHWPSCDPDKSKSGETREILHTTCDKPYRIAIGGDESAKEGVLYRGVVECSGGLELRELVVCFVSKRRKRGRTGWQYGRDGWKFCGTQQWERERERECNALGELYNAIYAFGRSIPTHPTYSLAGAWMNLAFYTLYSRPVWPGIVVLYLLALRSAGVDRDCRCCCSCCCWLLLAVCCNDRQRRRRLWEMVLNCSS